MRTRMLLAALAALCIVFPAFGQNRGVSTIGRYKCTGTGCVPRSMASKLGDVVSVKDACGDTALSNYATCINAGLVNLLPSGGTMTFPAGTFPIGATILIPNQVHIVGAGQRETIIQVNNGANVDAFAPISTDGWGASIERLQVDGNTLSGTNPSGNILGRGIYWKGLTPNDGPALVVRDVFITKVAGGSLGECNLVEGNLWVFVENVRVSFNRLCKGWHHKTSDSLVIGLYLVSNGGPNGYVDDLIVEGGGANVFIRPYLGGTGGLLVKGALTTTFVDMVIDSSTQNCARLIDGGVATSNTTFLGGHMTNCSQTANNTYDHISIEGATTNTIIRGMLFHNTASNKGRYALTELNTSTNTSCSGCQFNTLGTGVNNLRTGSGSRIVESPGYNPQGVAAITVTASPFTYTNNDGTPENVYMYAGTVSGVTKSGTTIFQSSPNDCWLEPGESIIVTYSVAPTMVKDRK